jgi:hypothetical protein
MKRATIDGVKVAFPDEMGEREASGYVASQKRQSRQRLAAMEIDIVFGGKGVELRPHYDTIVRFVRRNPGYISTADRFNEAKKAEERLRAAHMSIGREE